MHLEPEGTEVRTKFVLDVSSPFGGTHCDGNGNLAVTIQPGAPGHDHASVIWINRVDGDTTPWIGFPIVRGTPIYVLSISTLPSDKFTANCNSWSIDAGGRKERSFTEEHSHEHAVMGKSPLGCPPFLEHVCDPQVRTIQGENGRMHGSYHNAWEDVFHHDLEVRWSLCRDDAPCTEEPPEPEKIPCEGSAKQDGSLQTCVDAERDLARQAVEKWRAYQASLRKAAPHQADFVKAIAACVGWDATVLALEALLVADIPSVGLSGHAAEELAEFKESLEIVNQFMKAATTGDPLEAFKTGDAKKLETAIEAIKQAIEDFHLSRNSSEVFMAKLDECNAPISKDLTSSAQAYLLEMGHAFEELQRYNKLSNDIRSKDNECLQKQWDAYAACVQDARCRGVAESDCDSKKPPGDWPDVK